ncbi:MAG: LPS export ABC transporter periplasmic protein LptC [Flavobacteriales bacterium]
MQNAKNTIYSETKSGFSNLQTAIAILFGMAIAVSCSGTLGDDFKGFDEDKTLPFVEIWDFEMDYTQNGILQMTLTSPYAQTLKGERNDIYQFPNGFKLQSFRQNEAGESLLDATITADSAIYYKGKKLDAYQNVQLVDAKGAALQTNVLTWDEKKQTISTTDSVQINQNGQLIYGVGLDAKDDFSYYKIGQTTGIINVNAK